MKVIYLQTIYLQQETFSNEFYHDGTTEGYCYYPLPNMALVESSHIDMGQINPFGKHSKTFSSSVDCLA